ncbi:hypothetical protein GCM10011514_50990 [Emticicia aquatilis]|uniref:Immunoglobulin domain-containing protein n=1 Tax=Emticicia aquatilis TaxID=1537369 RepID=A0A917DYX0_9BACT|nr:GEVED domain-containing protein [Emticicia aquatilis]GGD80676.1 hypothetical protein GCM10011514_50990 [Emticicia aquatilis]
MKKKYTTIHIITVLITILGLQHSFGQCTPTFNDECSIALHSFGLRYSPTSTILIEDTDTQCFGPSTSSVINVTAGYTYNFDLSVFSSAGSDNTSAFFSIWLDKNNDGDFADTGERLYYNNSIEIFKPGFGPDEFASDVITIPADATTGVDLKFRVLVVAANDLGIGCNTDPSDACGTYCGGEIHDYTLNVSPVPICPLIFLNGCSISLHSFSLSSVSPVTTLINDLETGCLSPSSSTAINVTAGNSYNFDLTVYSSAGSDNTSAFFSIWLDKNNDGDFADTGERLYYNNSTEIYKPGYGPPESASGSITIPTDALTGTDLKFRVLVVAANDLGDGCNIDPDNACGMYCGGEVHDYLLNIEAPACVTPDVPTASNVIACTGTNVTLAATCATGTAYWYESVTSSTPLGSGSLVVNNVSSPNKTYSVSCEISETCVSNRVEQTITVIEIPNPPTVAGQTICSGSTASLTASCATGTAKWYESNTSTTVLGSGSFTTPNLTTPTTYFVACESGGIPNCVSTRTSQTVTVNDLPNPPVAAGQTSCSGSTASLTASCSTGTAKWYESSTSTTVLGAGTFTTPNLTTPTTYFVACESGGTPNCVSTRTSQTVTVNDLPNPPVAAGQTICSGSTASLTASCATGTAKWYESNTSTTVLGSGSFTTPNLSASITYFIACESGGSPNCVSARTSQNVTVNNLPNPPTVAGQTICSGSTASLTASCSTGTAKWYESSTSTTILGSGTFTTPNLSASTTYFVACESGGIPNCVSARTSQNVTVNDLPNPPMAAGQTICSGSTASLTASCSTGTAKWYESSTSTTVLGAGTFTTPNLSASTTYFVTCESGGSPNCVSARTSQNVTVNDLPNPPMVAGQTICSGSTASLTASCSTGTAKWYESSTSTTILGSGTFTTPNLSASTTYFVTCESGGAPNCVSTKTSQTVEIASYPLPNSVSNSPVCAEQNINLASTGGTSYSWQGPQGFASTLANPVIQNAQIANQGTYTVRITNQYNCSVTSTVSVIVNPNPIQPIIENKVLCAEGPNTTLTATALINHTLIWYGNSSTGGVSSTTAPTINPTIADIKKYYVSQINNLTGCESSRAEIIVTINSKPVPPLTTPLSICQNTPTQSLTANAQGSNFTILWYGNNSTGGIGSSIAPTPPTNAVGTTNYYVSKKDNNTGCESERTSLVYEVKATPITTISSNSPVCEEQTLSITVSGGVLYSWTGPNGFTSTNYAPSETLKLDRVNAKSDYMGSYTVTVSNNFACSATTSINVIINPLPTKPSITTDKTSICDSETATLTATGCNGSILWNNNSTGTSLIVSSNGTYTAVCLNSCGTSTASNQIIITKNLTPSAPIITTDKTSICNTEIARLTAVGCSGSINWSNGATGSFIQVNSTGTFSATCSNFCGTSLGSNVVTITKGFSPSAPIITSNKTIICDGERATLSASGCNGQIKWNTGESSVYLEVNNGGTYTATCSNICGESQNSNSIVIRAGRSPITPNIILSSPILCNETSKTLIATGCNGQVRWNTNSTGSTLNVTTAGTYTAVCENICGLSPRGNILNVQFLTNPTASTTNTGPYEIGQKIQLSASGGITYLWRGPNDFLSTNANVSILNANLDDRGIYTVTVTSTNGCTATAISNVVVNPCTQMFKYDYVKAGDNFEYFFPITDGMTINAMSINTGIIVTPICQLDTVNTPSVRIQMTGPEPLYNRDIIENIYPYSPFENRWFHIFGPIFPVGEYTLTVTGYSQEYAQGNIMFGPQTIHFTIVGNSTSITMTQNSFIELCAGSSLDVSFTTTGNFITGNVFEIQLSDANGSFETPIKIGESTSAGIVSCQIPANIPAGSGYKTRIFATKPSQMSNLSSTGFKVNPRNMTLQSPSDDISALINKKAGEKITATNKIQTGGNTAFSAGRSINLEAGFSVNVGAVFKAEIGTCN